MKSTLEFSGAKNLAQRVLKPQVRESVPSAGQVACPPEFRRRLMNVIWSLLQKPRFDGRNRRPLPLRRRRNLSGVSKHGCTCPSSRFSMRVRAMLHSPFACISIGNDSVGIAEVRRHQIAERIPN